MAEIKLKNAQDSHHELHCRTVHVVIIFSHVFCHLIFKERIILLDSKRNVTYTIR